MDYLEGNPRKQRNTERYILIFYSIYHFSMFLVSINSHWETWTSVFMAAAFTSSWVVYLGKYRDYHFRAFYTAAMVQVTLILYTIHLSDIFTAFATILALVVLMGVYEIPDLLITPFLSSTFILFFHGVILKTIQFTSVNAAVSLLLQCANIYGVEYIVYFWVKKRSDANLQLIKVIRELKETERSKDDFLANVSHEIRTPINTISGMSELILQEDELDKIQEDALSIQAAGRNLMSVVSDILDFSELQSGKMEIEEEAYNITSTINDIINMTIARRRQKNIELAINCDPQIPCALLGDEKKIRRVVMNLVNNALKFTEEGCVTITIESRRESYGMNLIIIVKDTGIGMKEESLERLFTSFNQVDTKRNRQEGGIGLGLAISRLIVEKMGGVISVRSKYGKGSSIKVVIPQKILDERPIACVKNREGIYIAAYFNMEHYEMAEIRDEYMSMLRKMIGQLGVRCCICQNLAEVKRRAQRESFSHVFISPGGYREDQAYFDQLALTTKLYMIMDPPEEKNIRNPNIGKIYKPFYILPVVSVLNGRTEKKTSVPMVRANRFIAPEAHVLVVDDNLMNIRVIEGLLQRYQIQVTEAMSGREALDKIEMMHYDFVFMDHMMPEMDGVETFHRIRKKVGTYYRRVPIIALTANAIAGAREKLLAEGFTDFVEKPVESSVLERVLRRNIAEDKIIELEEDNALAEAAQERIPQEPEPSAELALGDLDISKGLLYCGGRDQYMQILKNYALQGEKNWLPAAEAFEKKDWKNYTINVHAVKSSMLTIGAVTLSEMAKKLEQAGKENNISYIMENHEAMMDEYRRVIRLLQTNLHVSPEQNQEISQQDIPEISDEAFEQKAIELENAMYELDGGRMQELVAELQRFRYHGTVLEQTLEPVQKKIEMTDYMSAVEYVLRMKDKLKRNQEEE